MPSSYHFDKESILQQGRATLQQEQAAIGALLDTLDHHFVDAVHAILQTKGRVVVSGMGKSGHIARKIAATLAGTGTPAWFVHPAETSHGDLGCITSQDLLIVLSNSGETSEIEGMVYYAKQTGVPVIGMVRSARSMLADASDVLLLVPNVPEVQAIYPTPTSSAIMMFALGDALALATLHCRGLSSHAIERLHPGGKLGVLFTRVQEVMHQGSSLPICAEGASMQQVIVIMTSGCLGCVAVVNASGRLLGIVTDGDLRRHLSPDLLEQSVDSIMTRSPITVSPHMLASDALLAMEEHRITALIVVNAAYEPVGILHIHALLRKGIAR